MLMNVMIVEIILFFCKKIKEGGNMNSIQKYRGLAIADYFVKKCIEQNMGQRIFLVGKLSFKRIA